MTPRGSLASVKMESQGNGGKIGVLTSGRSRRGDRVVRRSTGGFSRSRRLSADDGGRSGRARFGGGNGGDRTRARFRSGNGGDWTRTRFRSGNGGDRTRIRVRRRSDRGRRATIATVAVGTDVEAKTTEIQRKAEVVGSRPVDRKDKKRGSEERGQGKRQSVAAIAFIRASSVHRFVS